jgi:peptide/nickel transport system ATP-binding protein
LKDEFGLTYLFIAHGLNVVKHISDRVGVMYLGRLMEIASKKDLYDNPRNPYTSAAVRHSQHRCQPEEGTHHLKGDVPSLSTQAPVPLCLPCFKAFEGCDAECPSLRDTGGGHLVACRLYDRAAV